MRRFSQTTHYCIRDFHSINLFRYNWDGAHISWIIMNLIGKMLKVYIHMVMFWKSFGFYEKPDWFSRRAKHFCPASFLHQVEKQLYSNLWNLVLACIHFLDCRTSISIQRKNVPNIPQQKYDVFLMNQWLYFYCLFYSRLHCFKT